MRLTVVTPVMNGAQFIRETLESVVSQDGDFELEYLIRDGGSTDGTQEIVAGYAKQHPGIRMISQPDGSPQQAINAGLADASGELGCWLNADDVFEPGTLQRVVEAFRRRPEILWLYGRSRIIDEDGNEIRRPITWYKNLLGLFYSRGILLCENFINQPSTFWRMDLWRDVGGLSTIHKIAFEYQLWMEMAQRGPAYPVREYLARFRRHTTSLSEQNFVRQFREELEIAARHGKARHVLVHRFNSWKIVQIYRLLS